MSTYPHSEHKLTTHFLSHGPQILLMSSVQVNILARSDFDEPGPDGKPKQMQRITYQLPDSRIGSVVISKALEGKPEEEKAIAESIKGLPKSVFETKGIKL